jgi:transketolase
MTKNLDIKYRFPSMKGWFAYELYNQMAKDEKIWLVVGDLGFGMFDYIRRDFPKRFINTGPAEQAMMGVGVGLALKGMKPFVYSITTFLLYRPFETIRNYVHQEKIPVRLIGSGRGHDYGHDGFSHWADEDKKVMNILSNVSALWPKEKEEIPKIVSQLVKINKPWYVNLRR